MSHATHAIADAPSWRTRPETGQLPIEVKTPARFLSALERARHADPVEEKAREAAEDFIASTLIKPVLAQMREMNDAAPPFGPGAHEKAFAGMVDDMIAERIVHAQRFTLVERIAKDMQARGAATVAASPLADGVMA